MSVPRHLDDAGGVAALLWERWLPRSVRRVVQDSLVEPASAPVLVRLLASWHDVGKVSPAFAGQVPARAGDLAAAGLELPVASHGQSRALPHGTAGGWVVREWLLAQGFDRRAANGWAAVVAAHHGSVPPSLEPPPAYLLGTGAWGSGRDALLQRTLDKAGAGEFLAGWGRRPLTPAAQLLLSAVVIVADWLASNEMLFPYRGQEPGEQRAARGWEALGLPVRWYPVVTSTAEGFWRSRFGFDDAQARPMQRTVVGIAAGAADPRLLIVEDSMGSGKTEAALAAAELLAARAGCSGVIVALPTMATSDAMFGRVLDWLDRLPEPPGAGWSTYLAHGKAGLNDEFTGLFRGDVRGVCDDDGHGAAVAHEWLSGRKKGLLSSFVVSTIDQVLVAALKHRHLVLRHLALASKVVVVDEVHASDPYMRTFLVRVLEWLGSYRVPVVLLSATLPPAQRAELVDAYLGRWSDPDRTMTGRRRGSRYRRGDAAGAPGVPPQSAAGYPLVTVVDGDQVRTEQVPAGRPTVPVAVRRLADDALAATLTGLLAGGGVAAVICNTVGRAQQAAALLRTVFPPGEVLLLHSRFLVADRHRLERTVRAALGPPVGPDPKSTGRPRRMLLVGTQVLEQSLDIDVDVMVTDLAPTDLLLQRIGRLHRHPRPPRPDRVATPVCLIRGVDWSTEPAMAVHGSRRVYGDAALLRTVTVLGPYLAGRPVLLPDDIAPLVRDTFRPFQPGDPDWPDALAAAEADAQAQRKASVSRAEAWRLPGPGGDVTDLFGLLSESRSDEGPRGQAAVRDGVQGVEVLLLTAAGEDLRLPAWIGSGQPLGAAPSGAAARAALGCAVRLPDWCTEQVLAGLGDLTGPAGWADNRWLRDTLVLRCTATAGGLAGRAGGLALGYDRRDGLTVSREAA